MKYIDLGLPSGTLWADENEPAFYNFYKAVAKFPDNLPKKEQFVELHEKCIWRWDHDGYTVIGPNGNSIFLPAAGYQYRAHAGRVGSDGYYWSSTSYGDLSAYYLRFCSGGIDVRPYCDKCYGHSVRLVKQKETNNINKLEIEIPDGKIAHVEYIANKINVTFEDKKLVKIVKHYNDGSIEIEERT